MVGLPVLMRRPKTVQVVIYEDDVATAEAYQYYLDHNGYRTRVFNDNEICRRSIRRQRPDIFICDIQSDVAESGLTLLDDLCTEFGDRLPPVIIATAFRSDQVAHHPTLRRLPRFRTLYKPFGFDEMEQVIRELL